MSKSGKDTSSHMTKPEGTIAMQVRSGVLGCRLELP